MKFVAYLRISTEQQIENYSLETQLDACQKFSEKQGSKISEYYQDAGLSGALSLDKRPGLLAAISSLEKNDILIVSKRDRLGRDLLVIAMIEAAVKRKKAKIVSVSGEGTENDDPGSHFMRRMIDLFAEYERLIIGARTKAVLQLKKSRNERVGRIPYGCKLAEDGVHLLPNEEEQAILNEMLTLRNNGVTLHKLAAHLNSLGLFNRNNSKWNHASIHRVTSSRLQNDTKNTSSLVLA